MNSAMCNFIPFFSHRSCKEKINKLIQSGLDDGKHIQLLNAQIITLMNQIQELKAIYDYQAFKFEETISELKSKLKSLTPKPRPMKRRPQKRTEPKSK